MSSDQITALATAVTAAIAVGALVTAWLRTRRADPTADLVMRTRPQNPQGQSSGWVLNLRNEGPAGAVVRGFVLEDESRKDVTAILLSGAALGYPDFPFTLRRNGHCEIELLTASGTPTPNWIVITWKDKRRKARTAEIQLTVRREVL